MLQIHTTTVLRSCSVVGDGDEEEDEEHEDGHDDDASDWNHNGEKKENEFGDKVVAGVINNGDDEVCYDGDGVGGGDDDGGGNDDGDGGNDDDGGGGGDDGGNEDGDGGNDDDGGGGGDDDDDGDDGLVGGNAAEASGDHDDGKVPYKAGDVRSKNKKRFRKGVTKHHTAVHHVYLQKLNYLREVNKLIIH